MQYFAKRKEKTEEKIESTETSIQENSEEENSART